jgi:aminoglycoside phosphotransferase (APT) family kinase protein
VSESIDVVAFEAWLAEQLDRADDVRVDGLRAPGAGASSDTHLFELTWTEAAHARRRDLVLRCAPREGGPFPEYDLAMQFQIMDALARHTDIPVPETLWHEEDPDVLGVPFLVMAAVEGDAPLDFNPSYQESGFYADATPALRAHMWRGTVEATARLHAADWRKLGVDRVLGARPGDDPERAELAYWRRYLDEWIKDGPDDDVPVFDEVLDWLESNRPEPDRLSLCWGDAKLGNVLYAPSSRDVAAVIDWELAAIGDPEQDLASLHLSDLRAQDAAGGVSLAGTPSRSELIALYEECTGQPVRNFHYNLVFATFWRGSVATKFMRQMRAKGADVSDEVLLRSFPVRQLCHQLDWPLPELP